ncbi:MAG: glycosyltransferase family 2 protein [Schleiferiaceae bacterium]
MVLITVIVPTYNHENYIKRCIDSITSQVVNFNFEIIIGNDGSTDRTGVVLDLIKNKNPNIIIVNQPQNQRISLCGPNGRANVLDLISRAKGEFIAICDGDDYWISESKLQMQIDLINSTGLDFVADTTDFPGFRTPRQLALMPSEKICTSSILLRVKLLKSFIRVAQFVPIGDWIWQLSAKSGAYLTSKTTLYNTENINSWTQSRSKKSSYWRCYYFNLYKALLVLYFRELRVVWLIGLYKSVKEQIQNGRF